MSYIGNSMDNMILYNHFFPQDLFPINNQQPASQPVSQPVLVNE